MKHAHHHMIEIVLIILCLTLALFVLILPARAAEVKEFGSPAALAQATPVPDDGVPTELPPNPTETPVPEPTETPVPNPITQIFQHIINFDATGSLLEAWTAVLEKAQEKAVEDLEPVLEVAAKQAAGSFLRFTSKGLEGLDGSSGENALLGAVKDLWAKVFSVAVLLFPLSVLLNIAAVMISGVSAPVARAEMLEALARALLILGISAGSFLLAGTMVKIAWGAAEVVAGLMVVGDASYLEELFIKLLIGSLTGDSLTSMLTIFITLTVIFLALMAISALILSYFALLTLTIGMVVLAPLVIVVGSLPEFRWVYATWLRAFVSVLLVPLANAILFKMWAVFTLQGKSLVDVLIGLGFICLVITLNFYAGKLVFAPAMEAGKMAVDSILAVVQLTVAAVGLAAGAAGLGAAGIAAGNAGAAGIGGLRGGLPGPAPGGGGAGTGLPGAESANGAGAASGFQNRVAYWRSQPPEARQAASAGLEQQSVRERAAGQLVHDLAGRNPLLRAAAGVWSAGRQSGTANERSAIRAADQLDQADRWAGRAGEGSQGVETGLQSPAVSNQSGAHGAVSAERGNASGLTAGLLTGRQSPSSAGQSSTGQSAAPLPPGAADIYPVLFGNPAYDERTLQARGWNTTQQANLLQNVQGYHTAAQAAASQAGLSYAGLLYDPLQMRPVQLDLPGSSGSSPGSVTPALFQAAAVRVSSPWLTSAEAAAPLPGAHILERPAAEQVLRQVAGAYEREPVGRLAHEILETSHADPGSWSPQAFWEQVSSRIRRPR